MRHIRGDYDRIQDPENKIPEYEPVFLIRGQDVCGPETLRRWADLNEQKGGDPLLSLAVKKQALTMEMWQLSVKAKVADCDSKHIK